MIPEGTVYNAMGRINRLSVLCIDAYGVAVKNGFVGTVEEWLASLKGEKGDPGDSMEYVTVDDNMVASHPPADIYVKKVGGYQIEARISGSGLFATTKYYTLFDVSSTKATFIRADVGNDGNAVIEKLTIDSDKNVTIQIASGTGGNGSLSTTAANLLIEILESAVYSTNVALKIESLKEALASGNSGDTHSHSYTSAVTTAATCTTAGVKTYTCSCGDSYAESIPATGHNYVDGVCTVCGAVDPSYSEDVTLTGISATYSGGDVTVGTAVTALTGISVIATYSDGSTEPVSGYALSGEIAKGSNTITVSYGGMTTTFTVTGVVTYTITNSLTNVTTNNSITSATEGTSYTATLTADDGYDLDSVTVTMGGVDVTATAYVDGVITISSVTGNVVITATATAQSSGEPVLVASWDFTKATTPLVDTVGGVEASVTAGTCTEGTGITFADTGGMVLPGLFKPGTKIVIKFGDYATLHDYGSQRYVLLMGTQQKGLVWRNASDGWGLYCSGWSEFFAADKSVNYLSGKTLTAEVGTDGRATLYTEDGTFTQHTNSNNFDVSGDIWIGQPNGNDIEGFIVESVNIYRI